MLTLLSSFSILLLLTTTATTIQSSDSPMDPAELETLFTVMESLSSDHHWRHSFPNPCHPASSWPGIQCRQFSTVDDRFHVVRLDFGTPPNPSCKDSAFFHPDILRLPHLESLFIFNCFSLSPTTISFPPPLAFISSSVQQFCLRGNPALVGTIPPRISSLKSLQVVTLSQNNLTGDIPARVFNLTSLVHLDLSYNRLTGSIPIEVGSLRSLVGLDLSYNRLVGRIPASIGRLGSLQKLDLSFNLLTGTVPESLRDLDSLVFLALSSNRLTGTLTGGVTTPFGLRSLQYFLMDDNPVSGTLPVGLGELLKLQEIRLSNSGYSGTIPPGYAHLQNLTTLSLQNNRLSGGIPAGFDGLSHVFHLNLSRNFLEGVVPFNLSFLKRLGRNLDLSGNPGLCLSAAVARVVAEGLSVGVCGGNGKTGSSMKPLEEESEAPLKWSMNVSLTIFRCLLIMLLCYYIL